jgi:two-component system sensor histidine kinase VicK
MNKSDNLVHQHELKNQIEILNDFLDHVNMPLRCIDLNGVIIWANQAELDLLAYNKADYIGSTLASHLVNPSEAESMLAKLIQNEVLTDYATFLKKANGQIIQVLVNSSIYRKSGEFIHTRCFTRDVTVANDEKKRAAHLFEELERNQQMLHMALDSAYMGTWDFDLSTNVLHCSDHCWDILGLSPNEKLTPETIFKHIESSDKAQVMSVIQQALSSGESVTTDFHIQRSQNGLIRYLQAKGKVYFHPDGTPSRFFGTVIDTTEATLASEKSGKLAAIIESSDDAIISKSLDSIITSWNPSAERMFGYEAAEMIGESITKLIPDDRLEEEPLIIAKLRNGERVDHFETIRKTKNGKLLDISLTISPIKNSKGEIIGVSKIARDISQQKKEQTRKNDFVAMVSHELKTPLTSMLGYIQLLMRKTPVLNNDFVNSALTKTELQVKKMMSMVHDFLNIARLEDGRIHLEKTVFELYPMAAEVVANIQMVSPHHRIHLNVPAGIHLYGDCEKIKHVLTNLLNNAVKYSPGKPEIYLDCQVIDKIAIISVSDEGIGIEPTHQEKLFERFYRVEQTSHNQPAGFGIGLYLIAELLRMHHSEIKVISELGKGSRFYFEMPIHENP